MRAPANVSIFIFFKNPARIKTNSGRLFFYLIITIFSVKQLLIKNAGCLFRGQSGGLYFVLLFAEYVIELLHHLFLFWVDQRSIGLSWSEKCFCLAEIFGVLCYFLRVRRLVGLVGWFVIKSYGVDKSEEGLGFGDLIGTMGFRFRLDYVF